jgi:hypothetical protein
MKYTGVRTLLPKGVLAPTHSQCFINHSYLKPRCEVLSDLDVELILVWQPTTHMLMCTNMGWDHICLVYVHSWLDTASSSTASKEYVKCFLAVFCNYWLHSVIMHLLLPLTMLQAERARIRAPMRLIFFN